MSEGRTSDLTEKTESAFFYIPDISGFTNFLKSNKLAEGAHLIHELLEVIIDSNISDMKVAEIQGDAVWFYRFGEPLTIEELEKQTIKTFTDFQAALGCLEEKYAGMAGAKKLTLKIIVHYGLVSTTNIKGTLKLLGSDTVIAHRILKNNVPGNEYLLMTEKYLETQHPETGFSWDYLKTGDVFYEHLGNIFYKYVSLTTLRKQVLYPC